MEVASSKQNIVIIGAGPAGLSLAYELKQLGLDCTLFEKGTHAGESWQSMPPFLRMVSTPAANTLGNDQKKPNEHAMYRMPAHAYADYLRQFSKEHKLNIKTGICITNIKKTATGFELEWSGGRLEASHVINATGYIANPIIPEVFHQNWDQLPIIHFHQFKGTDKVPPNARVLLVGKRLSAGQILDELHTREDVTIEVSTRSPIGYSLGPPWDKLIFANLLLLEKMILALGKGPKLIDVKLMDGPGVRKLKHGFYKIRPEVQAIHGNQIEFSDKSKSTYDMVILATGYAPALAHVPHDLCQNEFSENGFENSSCPRFYFLGLESQRNFRSRFIRGMREDARELASVIKKSI